MEQRIYELQIRRGPEEPEERTREHNWRDGFHAGVICALVGVASMLLTMAVLDFLEQKFDQKKPQAEPAAQVEQVEVPAPAIGDKPREAVEQAVPEEGWDMLTEEEMRALLAASEAGGFEPAVALGLIQVESGFDPGAVSPKGCYGYCQLNPRYFPTGLSPEDNITEGLTYLGEQLERYDGDLAAALTAYNAGHDTGDRAYARRVLAAAVTYEE